METNQNSINLKFDKIFSSLKRVARIVLAISSILLIISIISSLVYKGECFSIYSNAGFMIWPAIILSIYSIVYSLLIIVIFLVYKVYKRHLIWATIKSEILFLILTGLLLTIFYFVNSYMVKNYY
ncbi:hypothetical protein ACQ9BO_07545 [Flavobacterium sp. P21]|uniref:hypothetical protein n=1 Tax=Flavobacterium sp. P21 TaxID=3423948 RepID=UPI003D6671FF